MENKELNIYQKLIEVQAELKAPKGQYNSFGGYNYRSCEDILEAVKPIVKKYGLLLILKDSVEVQGERYYIKAEAKIIDIENGKEISSEAYARESVDKKGMDNSQVTGTASSYARKYALNGLFLIDDTKDADTDEYKKTTQTGNRQTVENVAKQEEVPEKINLEYAKKYVFQLGKHKGKTLEELNKTDRQYLEWYYKNGNDLTIKSCIGLVLKNNK